MTRTIEFPLCVIVRNHRPYELGALPELDEKGHDLRQLPGPKVRMPERDAWQLRREFLDLPEDTGELVKFLNRTGGFNMVTPFQSRWYWQVRRAIRELLLKPTEWRKSLAKAAPDVASFIPRVFDHLITNINFTNVSAKNPPLLVFHSTLPAILFSIAVDHLAGSKFHLCARNACQGVFRAESEHRRKYCGSLCAHAEAERRRRARLRKMKNRSKERKN